MYNYNGGDRAWDAVQKYHRRLVEAYHALSPAFRQQHAALEAAFLEIEDRPQGTAVDRLGFEVIRLARERVGED